ADTHREDEHGCVAASAVRLYVVHAEDRRPWRGPAEAGREAAGGSEATARPPERRLAAREGWRRRLFRSGEGQVNAHPLSTLKDLVSRDASLRAERFADYQGILHPGVILARLRGVHPLSSAQDSFHALPHTPLPERNRPGC